MGTASRNELMAERDVELESMFPQLAASPYAITSPRSPHYNCVAWAAGRDDVWMWPDPFGQAWWPAEATRKETIDAFIEVFALLGYERCETAQAEAGFEKLALFAVQGRPTHAARQLPDGRWTSKCGSREDIAHILDALAGTNYGEVAVIVRRSA